MLFIYSLIFDGLKITIYALKKVKIYVLINTQYELFIFFVLFWFILLNIKIIIMFLWNVVTFYII